MRKLGVALVVSLLFNALLSGWLVAQYLSDVYFRIYLNQFFASNSTYLILTLGVGGGSTVGYLFLRRRGHLEHSSLSGLQKTKPLKTNGGIHSPSLATASQARALPAGAPPSQPSKHTAYAVPPISKSPSPSSSSFQKATPAPTWTTAGNQVIIKQPGPPSATGLGPRQPTSPTASMDRVRQPTGAPSELRAVSSSVPSPVQRPEQFPTPRREPDTRPGQEQGFSKWQPELGKVTDKSEPTFFPPNPVYGGIGGGEPGLKRVPIQGMGPAPQQPSSQPQAQPQASTSKWQSPDSGARPSFQAPTGQWVSPVPKQPYNPGARPVPQGTVIPGQRPQPPSGLPMRPGQASPPRPLFPPGQGAPRPLAYPGASRPMQAGQGAPGTFRPGLVVTGPQRAPPRGVIPGQAPGQRPPQSSNLSPSSDVKSSPSLSSGRSSQGEATGLGQPSGIAGAVQGPEAGQSSSSTDKKPSSEGPSGSEMDWDTALDTILKTLRKDKVGEK